MVGLREEALFPDQEWHYLIFFNLFFWFPITYDKNLTGGQLFVICNWVSFLSKKHFLTPESCNVNGSLKK